MAAVTNKRSVMTLYSDSLDIYCHRVRMVLAEKGVNVEIIDVNLADKPEDLGQLNPYNSVPTLVDRDLIIYESRIIMEYLDERFPHPPLMPVYPVQRAKNRQIIYRIDREMYKQYHQLIDAKNDKDRNKAKQLLLEMIVSLEPVFAQHIYFLNEEFSMVDCCLAALIWRLPQLGITIPIKNKGFHAYCERVFERHTFKESLSDAESEFHVERIN
jgi:stringent starvation protein A